MAPRRRPRRAGIPALLAAVLAGMALSVARCGGQPPVPAGPPVIAGYAYAFPPDLPFDPAAWTTNEGYAPLGDPRAVRVPGRALVVPWLGFPTTLRTHGPNANSTQTSSVHGLLYESLIQIDPETEDYLPCLASHWRIDPQPDGTQVLTFRLDERARWADGRPVQADDVYASWWHRVQEDRKDPSSRMTFAEGYEEPEVLDRWTVRVRTRKPNWRLFLYFGGMSIYPAREVSVPGDVYLSAFNWTMPTGSGPYRFRPDLLRKGETLVLERREDWWAEDERWATHTYNFDRIKYVVIRDEELIYEKFKAGEIDYYEVGAARRWVEDVPRERIVKQGWVKRRKVYNQQPVGFSGLCFNMRRPPFDDVRVREAFALLLNREMLMEKLFYGEYEYTNSIFPGRDWGSGTERPRVEFDPDRAEELLAEAGYRTRDAEGYLLGPNGKRLEVTLEYANQGWERIWLPLREAYEDAGVRFELKLIDGSTLTKRVSERQFKVHHQGWGALLFPNPETSWSSSLADKPYNNNIPGFADERVDELCRAYNLAATREEQKRITREIDTIVCGLHPYAFLWHSAYFRILCWDRFGHPDSYVTRVGQSFDDQVILLWWFDPVKEERLRAAMASGTTLPAGETIVRPWGP